MTEKPSHELLQAMGRLSNARVMGYVEDNVCIVDADDIDIVLAELRKLHEVD
jgi:hypothetical protein